MSFRRCSWVLQATALAWIAAASGCDFRDAADGAFLSVGFARTQPATAELGVVVSVQQRGGSFLRLRTAGGTHQLSTTEGSAGVESSCVKLPASDGASGEPGLLFFSVKPQADECMLYADLLSDGASCSGSLEIARFLLVSRERATAAEAAQAGATGTGGASGAGGKGGSATGGQSTGGGGAGGTTGGGTTTTGGTGGSGGGP